MRNILTVLFLTAFLALPVLGFAFMAHSGGHDGCAMSVIDGFICPIMTDPFGMAVFHINIFKSVWLAVLNANIFSLIISVAVFLALVYLANPPSPASKTIYRPESIFESLAATSRYKFLSWFSFHENSPAFLVRRL